MVLNHCITTGTRRGNQIAPVNTGPIAVYYSHRHSYSSQSTRFQYNLAEVRQQLSLRGAVFATKQSHSRKPPHGSQRLLVLKMAAHGRGKKTSEVAALGVPLASHTQPGPLDNRRLPKSPRRPSLIGRGAETGMSTCPENGRARPRKEDFGSRRAWRAAGLAHSTWSARQPATSEVSTPPQSHWPWRRNRHEHFAGVSLRRHSGV
jgi:hypothetical protein